MMRCNLFIDFSSLEKHVTERYKRFCEVSRHFNRLVRSLNEVFIFGGWVRDCVHGYIHKEEPLWNDVDLVINGQIDPAMVPNNAKLNNFGGYKMVLADNGRVDLWQLEQTLAFSEGFFQASIENLLKSTVFGVNSIVFNTKSLELMTHVAVRDISQKNVGFNCKSYLHLFPELQVFRAIELA